MSVVPWWHYRDSSHERSQRRRGGAGGGSHAEAPNNVMVVRLLVPTISLIRGEDAGENSSLLRTTSMTHWVSVLLEGDVGHL